jgi:hypothetical protein
MKQLALALLFSFSATIDAYGSDQGLVSQEEEQTAQFTRLSRAVCAKMDSIDTLLASSNYKGALDALIELTSLVSQEEEQIAQFTGLSQAACAKMDSIDTLLASSNY